MFSLNTLSIINAIAAVGIFVYASSSLSICKWKCYSGGLWVYVFLLGASAFVSVSSIDGMYKPLMPEVLLNIAVFLYFTRRFLSIGCKNNQNIIKRKHNHHEENHETN